MRFEFDYVLVGGGLQNGLIALALLRRRPELRLALVERDSRLGGNHTWCFHASDVRPEAAPWIEPLVVKRWSSYEVIFPGRRRELATPYAAISSERFDDVVRRRLTAAPGCSLFLDREAVTIEANAVGLAGGHVLTATTVIDARGPDPGAFRDVAGFQKFVGLEVRLARGTAPGQPIIMDARVSQEQGFHFVYLLPFARDRLLVEDTLFAADASLREGAMRQEVLRYLERLSLTVGEVLREESGLLAMPWAGAWPALGDDPLVAGVRGGWFHPGTGYSISLALRVASLVADRAPEPPQGPALDELRRTTERQLGFVHLLNWMLFRIVPPAKRWRLLERFYTLPDELITRYYALDLSLTDRARILFQGNPLRELRWLVAGGKAEAGHGYHPSE